MTWSRQEREGLACHFPRQPTQSVLMHHLFLSQHGEQSQLLSLESMTLISSSDPGPDFIHLTGRQNKPGVSLRRPHLFLATPCLCQGIRVCFATSGKGQYSSETLQQQCHEHKLPWKRAHVDNWTSLVDSKDQLINMIINTGIVYPVLHSDDLERYRNSTLFHNRTSYHPWHDQNPECRSNVWVSKFIVLKGTSSVQAKRKTKILVNLYLQIVWTKNPWKELNR